MIIRIRIPKLCFVSLQNPGGRPDFLIYHLPRSALLTLWLAMSFSKLARIKMWQDLKNEQSFM